MHDPGVLKITVVAMNREANQSNVCLMYSLSSDALRLPYRNDAKIAQICNLWTLWLVIQLINHLFKIRQKAYFLDFEKMAYWLNYRPKCPEVEDFCCFGIISIR